MVTSKIVPRWFLGLETQPFCNNTYSCRARFRYACFISGTEAVLETPKMSYGFLSTASIPWIQDDQIKIRCNQQYIFDGR